MRTFIFTLLLIISTAFTAFALDFYGVKVTDRDAPSSFMRSGVTGYHPTVIEIPVGSPAATYGFNQGDIILSINSKEVRRSSELNQFMTDRLSVLVFSGSERKTLTINRQEIETKKAALIDAKKITAQAAARQQSQVEENVNNLPTVVFNADYYEKKYGKSIKAPVNNTPSTNRVRPTEARKYYAGNLPTPRGRVYSSSGCETGHWVQSVSDGGHVVILEDGSVWEIDAYDAIDSALWLPTTDIIACDEKLINTDDNETVSATRLR